MSKSRPAESVPLNRSKKAKAESIAFERTEVRITLAKGRPMLTWVGKQSLSRVTAFPTQYVESFESPQSTITNPKSDIRRDWSQPLLVL